MKARLFKRLALLTTALLVAVLLLLLGVRLLYPLPDVSGRAPGRAIPAAADTLLGGRMLAQQQVHPGKTGVLPLLDGHDALLSRLALVAKAERSIDAQYYIWHDDTSGNLLLKALHEAAKRGVKVRLLLDDNGIHGLDGILATLDAEPGIDVRIFNPSMVRRPKMLGFGAEFMRMNRRMHNKALIVDGAATIIGGRNIGDEYFKVDETAFFADMDVLATGAVVPEVAASFDDYWNSASVIELARIVSDKPDLPQFLAHVKGFEGTALATRLKENLQRSATRMLVDGEPLEWTTVQLAVDDPIKGTGKASDDQLMINRLGMLIGEVRERLDLASAYFIPGRTGSAYFEQLARTGKQVRVLTNAMNTTDVVLVHAGYTRYRRELLKAGVTLYELKLRGTMSQESDQQLRPLGLSGASLHAKTFAVDNRRVFIGSFNFDPRSARLNCEMGLVIDSPTMARRVHDSFDQAVAQVSYRPELTPENKLVWHEAAKGKPSVTYQEEPDVSWLRQILLAVAGMLPIEWLL